MAKKSEVVTPTPTANKQYSAVVRVAVRLQRELSHLAPDTYGSQKDAEKKVGSLIAQELAAQ
ncbi:MAG: hypothetical protein ABIH23_28590 [bacterium]